MGCDAADEPETRETQQKLTPEEQRTLRFELVSDWQVWSGQGTIENDPLHSEGSASLEVVATGTTSGFVGVRNLTPLTKDEQAAPEVVGFDVWIPSAQLNPNWHGDTQLSIDAPSAGIYQQYLGYRSFQDLPKDQFVRVEFPVADWIRNALDNTNYTDLRFVISINTTPGNPAHYLDQFTLGPVDPTCTPVDDGNPCTADECQNGQTTHVPLAPGALCADANVCNGTETCDGAGTCQAGTPLVVDDENPCTADSCDPTGGVTNVPVAAGTACDDDDVCNGAEFCDAEGACQDAPDLDPDDGNPCTTDSCDPITGVSNVPVAIGTSCADADVCNGEETCSASGTCEPGTPLVVDDGNICTTDSCDPVSGVSNTPVAVGTSCDDGNVCNGVSTCDASASCIAGAPPTIDDGNECTADSCDPVSGVSNIPVSAGVSCGDGDACNGDDVCDGTGACVTGTPPIVDDGNPCTADACDPVTGVSHIPVSAGASCADGDLCNGAETCDGSGACQSGTPVETDDGNECTIGSCDPATGVVSQDPVPNGAPCGDGDLCNGSEFCDGAGLCATGTPLDPDDGNACTVDSCDPLFGIDNSPAPAGTECLDDDVCNGSEACDGLGACQAGTPLETDDGNSCTMDSCDPISGVANDPLEDGASCSDGDACTVADSCDAGVCTSGLPIVCGALSTCHEAGVCDPATGLCSDPVKPDGSACDDGVACTAGDSCEAGACVGGDSPVLEEAPCRVAECDGETGGVTYTFVEEGAACELDACTQGGCSANGECLMTETTVVDDLDPCTVDFCDPILGPVNVECSEIDMTVATTVLSAYSWLFTGAFPVQTGVNPSDIEERRAALVSGSVTNRAGDPLPSVSVTVQGHPEFGQTVTQANGTFQMVVNGGGTMQVQFHKAGYLDSARRVDPKWNQTHTVDDVIMIVPDPVVTEISLDDAGEEFQVAQSSIVSDDDGERQGTLLVPPGTVATMRLSDGTEQMLDTMHVRITEFTVGPEGPDAMPATLPVNTAYTYAFEANADEAVAAGAPSIEFSEPLVYYVENFIGFPVGETVPVGAYDREGGQWVPHDSGVVIEVLDVAGGVASVDLTGNGVAATPTELDQAGITPEELERLGVLYGPGTELWRVLIPHFTWPYDCNWPYRAPAGAEEPPADPGPTDDGVNDGCEAKNASTLDCQTRVFHEEADVAGSPFSLHYSSERVPGRLAAYSLEIPVTDETPPESLKRVDVSVTVAGRTIGSSYGPGPNQRIRFTWDGLNLFGQEVQGSAAVSVRTSYVYDGVYAPGTRFNFPPGDGSFVVAAEGRIEMTLDRSWTGTLGVWKAVESGLGAWSLTDHHAYDAGSGRIYRGDGTTEEASMMPATMTRLDAQAPFPSGFKPIAGGPDGSVYICAWNGFSQQFVRKIAPDGTVTTIAGTGPQGSSGDGGPATAAQVRCNLGSLAVGPDGSVYLGDYDGYKVRRIAPDGIIETVAGTGVAGSTGDGGPATEARLGWVTGISVGPDGTLYITDRQTSGAGRLIQVGTDGVSDTIYFSSRGVDDVEVEVQSGRVYFISGAADTNNTGTLRVFRLGPDGLPEHVLGCGNGDPCLVGDYSVLDVPAAEARFFSGGSLARLGFGPKGELFVAAATANFQGGSGARFLWRLDPDGIVRPYLGERSGGIGAPFVDGVVPELLNAGVHDLATSPDGLAVSLRSGTDFTYKISPALPGIGIADSFVPASDGSEIYHFDFQGRHLETLHGHTFDPLWTFEYDENGLLARAIDAQGLVTTIERASEGDPQAIIAPYGQRTELAVGADGYLSEISPPGQHHYMTYGPGGLMETFEWPTGDTSSMSYDELGRISVDTDRDGAPMSLVRTDTDLGWDVTRTTAEGRTFDYVVEKRPDNEEYTHNTAPDGTSSTTVRDRAGNTTTTFSDGTQITVKVATDPAYGIVAPLPSRTTILPSGLTRTTGLSRSVNQTNPNDPSSLVSFIETSQVNDLTTTTEFTRNNLRYRTTTPEGRVSDQFIDATGRTTSLTAAGSPTVRTQYDADKVSAIIIDPDGIMSSGDERSTQMFYDANGRLVSVVDPLTHETLFGAFDASDRPQTITLPDDSEVMMSYDVEGNVASVTPPGKAAHQMTYRSFGRIESYTPPVGNGVQFIYDQDRRMDLIDFGPDAFNQPNQVDFEYDPVTHQLSTITSPTGVINVGFTEGRMTSLSAPSMAGTIVTSIDYDGFLPTSLNWTGPVAGEVNWTYNDRFLIESETIGALPETTVTYEYDDDGLVTQAGDLEITRDPASGRVVQKTIGRIRETFEYNEYAELSRQTVEFLEADMTTVRETLYDVVYDDDGVNGDRDALGRITKKTEWIVSGDTPNGDGTPRALDSRTYDYGYNSEGRPWLESVAVDGNVVSSYSYDDNGNRTAAELSWSQLGYDASFDVSLSEVDTEYDSADKLLTYGTKSYTWNNFGQLESMTDSDPNGDGDTSDSEVTFYQYDLFGNLLRVDLPDGRAIEYDVDGAGRRVGRRELDASGVEISFRGWIYRDLLRPIAEVDAQGNVVARYVYGDGEGSRQNGLGQLATRLGAGQDASLGFEGRNVPEMIEIVDGSGTVVQRLSLVTNQVGSVQLVSDAVTGEVVQRLSYDEFGRVTFDSNPGAQPFGFAGGMLDHQTQLHRFGARDYDAALGRWASRDAIRLGNPDKNPYVYAGNRPIDRVDPTGLLDWGPLGGRCCNESSRNEFAITGDGNVESVPPGGCTSSWSDCDGMTCDGEFNSVGNTQYTRCGRPERNPRDRGPNRGKRWSPGCGGNGKSPGDILEGNEGTSGKSEFQGYDWDDSCGCQ